MIRQRTIKGPVTISGAGLQTGGVAKLTLRPSPANSGINFIRTDLENKPLLNIQSIDFSGPSQGPERRTTVEIGPVQIQTTEHLLAALSGLSIDNIVIELDGTEVPGLDGSAKAFVETIKKGGLVEQDAQKKMLEIDEPIWCGKEPDSFLAVFPDDDFKVSYTLSYENPNIGTQFFSLIVNEKNFEREVAPARTFCLEKEALQLLKMGLGKGANYENTLVLGKNGPVKNALRFPNEPVRHKVLDLIGDLYLLGAKIKGRIVAIKSGHSLNMELVKRIKEKKYGQERV